MSKHTWFNVENCSYRNSAVPGFSLTRYRDRWLLSNSMLKDFSRAVYWEIVKFPSNQLLSVAFTSRLLLFFLIFECMTAKIINYRFWSSDCRASLAVILLLCFSCKDRAICGTQFAQIGSVLFEWVSCTRIELLLFVMISSLSSF